MPYRRRYARRPRRRTRGGGTVSRYMGYAQKALKVARFVRSIVNVEYKYIDTTAGVSMSSSGAVALLTGIAVGTTQTTRNGNSILAKSIWSQITFKVNAAATASTICRYMLVMDKQDSSSLPSITEILQTASVYAPITRNNGDRFKVLCDKRFTVSLETGDNAAGLMKCFRKLQTHIKYLGDTAAQSDVGENHIYVVTITDSAANNPTVNHTVRTRFIDN